MPMKDCCPFIVYMPNKPDKFGINFWLLVELESKYMVNLRPYLGAQEKESKQGDPLAQDVVLRLVSPVKSKGYNFTTDNFFTSLALAEKVRTVRTNSKDIIKIMIDPVKDGTNKSTFYYNDQHYCLFVNYQCKIKKSVCLFSTIHNSPFVDDLGKNKLDAILFYNKNKVGVGVVDQMVSVDDAFFPLEVGYTVNGIAS